MGKAIKIVLVGGVIVAVVVAVLVFVVLSNLGEIVKQVVETVGSDVMGTRVTLEAAEVSLKTASATLTGFTVANPPGFETEHALRMGRIAVGLDAGSIGSDEIVLTNVKIDGTVLKFEQTDQGNNLQTLLDHVSGSDEPAEAPEEDEVTLVIETFRLAGAGVDIHHPALDEPVLLRLDSLELSDIGRVGAGETAASVARQILEPILRSTLRAARQYAEDQLEERLDQEVEERKQEAVESLKKKLLGD